MPPRVSQPLHTVQVSCYGASLLVLRMHACRIMCLVHIKRTPNAVDSEHDPSRPPCRPTPRDASLRGSQQLTTRPQRVRHPVANLAECSSHCISPLRPSGMVHRIMRTVSFEYQALVFGTATPLLLATDMHAGHALESARLPCLLQTQTNPSRSTGRGRRT